MPKPTALQESRDESTRTHRAVNWVVSVILVVFAIWSIHLNSEGRSMYKQTLILVTEMDAKIATISNDLKVVKDLCQPTTVVVPPPTTDTQETP